MKYLAIAILVCMHCQVVCGQTNANHQFFQTNSKSNLYYVDLKNEVYMVYGMGRHLDLGVSGYSIFRSDTLQKQQDSSYSGRYFRIIQEDNGLYLINIRRKNRKFRLYTASAQELVNNNLNNAYYLDHYLEMISNLTTAYPLSNHDFRQAFYTWNALPEKEKKMDHLQFREFTDKRIKEINDSTRVLQDRSAKLTNYVMQNIRSISYTALKDSLVELSGESAGNGSYYGEIIEMVALQQPSYFFRLAEDLPENRSSIFWGGVHIRRAYAGLRRVEGHDEMKKAFSKEKRDNTTMQIYALGAVALGAALFTSIFIAII